MTIEDDEDKPLHSVALQNAESIRIARRPAEQQAEAKLRQQAQLLNLTHDAILLTHDAILVRDMNGTIKYWSRGAEELYGWPAEQAVGRVIQDMLKAVLPAPLDQIERELVGAGRWEGEIVDTKKDGSQIVVVSRWFLQRDEQGRTVAVLETNHNITERKRAEEALRKSERQFRALFDQAAVGIVLVNSAGCAFEANRKVQQMLGYSAEEFHNLHFEQVTHPADRKIDRNLFAELVSGKRDDYQVENRYYRKDGSLLWGNLTVSLVRNDKGEPLFGIALFQDITEQKRAQEAARRSEKELRDLIETVPTMVFSIRPDGSTEFVNQRCRDYAGFSLEAISGGWEATVHPDDSDTHMKKWRASLASGQPFANEVRHRSTDGEYRWFLVRAVPVCDQTGKILKWYGVLTDIEDRKRAEALLAGEKRILEMVAKGEPLAQMLDSLCRLVEEQASGVLASILLVDGDRLRHGGAPSLPKAYTDAIEEVGIGPSVGSCGTAAYRGEQVIVQDIATDPLWADFRQLALPYSLRACWSTPVFSSQGKVIATFAMYYREPHSPSHRDQEIIEQITHLAGAAIERKLTQEALRRSEAYLAEAQRLSHTGSWAFNHRGNVYWSEETCRIWGFDPQDAPPSREAVLQRIHPEDRDRVLQCAQAGLREKRDYADGFRIVLPDGTVRHVHGVSHPVFDAKGELVEVVGTHVDVTERKRAEQERERLRQLEADLAHINRVSMIGELAASLAHEIKQPIAAAVTNAKTSLRWLQREPPDSRRGIENDHGRKPRRRHHRPPAPLLCKRIPATRVAGCE